MSGNDGLFSSAIEFFVNCLDGRLFDPFTKQCSNYSACYHGCRNSTDKEGKSFDLKEKKCLGPVLKHIFECKNSENLPNALLTERIVFDEQFCLNW
ncbi:unnamed protein product [Brachionus calyciflorus]|uniref:Uncharacterized protein n=1 Tax=Brachionus calyciflorus TaxID=104777 RepID=A0A813U2Q0_9BILA|nr:unnamed protein product [Brachionus calyciflorus]